MFGFGFGSRNPRLRVFRLGALAVLLLAGLAFHHRGSSYELVRGLYYAGIVGLLGYSLYRRRQAGPPAAGGGGWPDPDPVRSRWAPPAAEVPPSSSSDPPPGPGPEGQGPMPS